MAEGVRQSIFNAMDQVSKTDPSLGLQGLAVNQSALNNWTRRLMPLNINAADPKALMAYIDAEHKRNSGRSPGSQSELGMAQVAAQALSDIYGINNYSPQGFMEFTGKTPFEGEQPNQWVNPRPFMDGK